jgi:hypothetical protein
VGQTETGSKGTPEEPSFPLLPKDIEAFAGSSPALGVILRASEAERIVAAYEREDRRAIETQTRFVYVATHLNRSVLATACIGALILTLGVLQASLQNIDPRFGQAIPWALGALGMAGLFIGGYATARMHELNAGDLARVWMQSRARAEQLRSEYFDRVVARATTADPAAQIAALDLVMRHLLVHQLTYFGRRGKRHEASAGHWLQLAAFAAGIASVGVAAGGMAGAAGNPLILAIAALGPRGGATGWCPPALAPLGQEQERAERFRNNVDALELLARKIEDVRAAVASGTSETLATFTTAINQQLALELGRFLEGGESIRASIATLSQQIEKSQKASQDVPAQPQKPGGAGGGGNG